MQDTSESWQPFVKGASSMTRTIEWTDRGGQRNVLVLDAGLDFGLDPLPSQHDYDPLVRRWISGSEQLERRGPECLGCLPYQFAETHPIHTSASPLGSPDA